MKTRARNHSLAVLLAPAILALTLPSDAAQPTPGSRPAPHPTALSAPRLPPSTEPSTPQSALTNFSGFDHIQFQHLNWSMNSGDFNIPDRFTAVRQGTELTADEGNGNSKKKILHASGHVIVHQTQALKSGGDVTKVTQEPSTLTCDKLDADGARKIYVATGNVHFTQATREGWSDVATLDDATHILHMEGHVHLRDKEQLLDADDVDYNTITGETHVTGKPALIRLPIETPTPGSPKTPAPKKRRLL
jgi:lipopolysaccharide assembly outer membrane protein LptD (OstA)